jgi:hypothetical protein
MVLEQNPKTKDQASERLIDLTLSMLFSFQMERMLQIGDQSLELETMICTSTVVVCYWALPFQGGFFPSWSKNNTKLIYLKLI